MRKRKGCHTAILFQVLARPRFWAELFLCATLLHPFCARGDSAAKELTALPAPFLQLTSNDATGFATIALSGLPELAGAQFSVADLTPATSNSYSITVDPTPQTPLTIAGSGAAFVVVPVTFLGDPQFTTEGDPRFLVAEVSSASAPELRLFVGADINADGAPQPSEMLCESDVSAGTTARCVVDLAGTITNNPAVSNLWIAVDIPSGNPGIKYPVALSHGEIHVTVSSPGGYPSNHRQVVSGPGHVPANADFPLRYSWNAIVPMLAGERYYNAIFVDAAPTQGAYELGQVQIVPFAITRDSGASDDVPFVSAPYDVLTGYIAFPLLRPGESLHRAFVDVPPNASSLSVGAARPFSMVRTEYPAAASSQAVAGVPPNGTAIPALPANNNGGYAITLQRGQNLPGRWYVVASGDNLAQETQFVLNSAIAFGENAPALTPGNYFNPARPGHGIFISQASGSQVVTWYTYLEDGTPTWYFIQAQAPQASQTVWTAPMYRASWNGSAINATAVVGLVVITTIAPNELIFSYNLEGHFGSERMVWLSSSSCPLLNGANNNLAGNWFAPAQPGYGIDVLAGPDFQFDVFYLYDAMGLSRWVVGQAPFAASTTVTMNQSEGFCPACDYVPVTFQPIGTLDLQFGSGTAGQMSTSFGLIPPLAGTWNVDQPSSRLTGSTACK